MLIFFLKTPRYKISRKFDLLEPQLKKVDGRTDGQT